MEPLNLTMSPEQTSLANRGQLRQLLLQDEFELAAQFAEESQISLDTASLFALKFIDSFIKNQSEKCLEMVSQLS